MQQGIRSLFQRMADSRREAVCERCGRRTELFFGKGVCDDCMDHMWAEREEARRRSLLVDYQAHLIRSGLLSPDTPAITFAAARPASRENAEAVARLRTWSMAQNLFLYGPSGVGKSFYARCLLNGAMRAGKSVAEMPVRSLLTAALRYDRGRGTFAACCRADVLLVDDIDKGAYNEDRLGAIWELLDARCQGGRRTIVTSNLDPVELAKDWVRRVPQNTSYGVAALDRLKPVSVCALSGVSLR